jgi:two-component system response regulator QseB
LRILLVEDDQLIASGLKTALERAHHTVEHAGDGQLGLSLSRDSSFDLLILDLGLPKKDGLELLGALRDSGSTSAVLILSARDGTADRVKGLDLGADDYLVKPFELSELLARVRVLERRRASVASNVVQRGALELDLNAMTLAWKGRPIDLTRREWMLLRLLVENPTRVYSRAQIEEALYGWGEGADSNAIDVHVHHLRRRIDPAVVQTIRGVGYRLGDLTE